MGGSSIGSAYSSGEGGATDTVVGSSGITNVGTNTNADLAPTYGTTAGTVCEGNDSRLAAAAGWSVVTETTATRSAADGEFVLVDVASCVVTLPAPVADARIAVKVITATITDIQIRTSGAGIDIDGTDYSSAPGLALSTQYEQISVVSDGTDWFIY